MEIIQMCGDTTGSHGCDFTNGLNGNIVHINKQPTKTNKTLD
jgi:hypothetical protein